MSSVILDFIISILFDISLKDIKRIRNMKTLKKSGNTKISESIESVRKNLEESREIIENALVEMENQKNMFEQTKKEAEISQQISSMNQEQVEALSKILEGTLNNQEKKTFPKTMLLDLIFCFLSAIIGFFLGKFF